MPGSAHGRPAEEDEELVLPALERDLDSGPRTSAWTLGRQLSLELQEDRGFLAPGFTLQTMGRRPEPDVLRSDPVGDLAHCFYLWHGQRRPQFRRGAQPCEACAAPSTCRARSTSSNPRPPPPP